MVRNGRNHLCLAERSTESDDRERIRPLYDHQHGASLSANALGRRLRAWYAASRFSCQRGTARAAFLRAIIAGLCLTSVIVVALPNPAAATSFPNLTISVGYADNYHTAGFFPTPWHGSSNVVWEGCSGGCSSYDGGAVLITNSSSSSVTINSVDVKLSTCTYQWPNSVWTSAVSLNPGQSLIVDQTASGAGNGCTSSTMSAFPMDTSDIGPGGSGWATNCSQSGVVPDVVVTANTVQNTLTDADQVLNTGGVDRNSCPNGTNESEPWTSLYPTVGPQGGPPTPAETRAGGSPSEPCAKCQTSSPKVGEPIDPSTGDFYETTTDLNVSGAGLPLQFVRTYDSLVAQQQAAASSPGPLGYGWSDNLGMSLSTSGSTATVTEENGSQITFNSVTGDTDAWCATVSVNYCPAAPRIIASLNQNTDGSWTFTRQLDGDTMFNFNSAGVLTSITDTLGNKLSEASGTPGTGECPSSASSCTVWSSYPDGESTAQGSLTLAFDSTGQLVSVTDSGGNQAQFCFYGQSCASGAPSSGGQTNDLYSADLPGPSSPTTFYTYDKTNSNSHFQHDLVTLTPPGASTSGPGQTQNQYYPSSGQISQQTEPDGAVDTLAYSGNIDNVAGGMTTMVSYPQGTGTGKPSTTTVYSYSQGSLSGTTINDGTSSQATSLYGVDPASLLPLSSTDFDSNNSQSSFQTYSGSGGTPTSSANVLTTADAVGNTTASAYNTFNQPWCQVDAADYANGTRCPSSAPSTPPSPGSADPNLGMTISFYNSSDQLTATTDALGNTTTYAYTSGVSGVPNGLIYCSVDPVQYQASVSCPAYGATYVAGTTTETFNSAGNKTSSTNAIGGTTTYVYGSSSFPWLPTQVTDVDGTVTTYTYNSAGQVTQQVQAFGTYSATTVTAHDAVGRLYCTIAPLAYSEGETICPSTPPTTAPTPGTDPWPGVTITIYNGSNQPIYSVNPQGGVTQTTYDAAGNVICTAGPNAWGYITCPTSPPTPPTTSSDPYLHATITSYDADERVIQVTNPLGGITLTTYDPQSNVVETQVESSSSTSSTDPTVTTKNVYDVDNRVSSSTLGYGSSTPSTTLTSYDPNGNAYCTISGKVYASGSAGSAYQCPPWQVSWIVTPPNPAGSTPLYTTGTPTSSQAKNVTTTFDNANGQEVQTTDPDIQTTVTAVDGDGQTYCTSDPSNVATWILGNPTTPYPYLCPSTPPTSPPTGTVTYYTTTIYDAEGNTLSSTDQVGETTSYTYDAAGDKTSMTDPRGKVTSYCYYGENGSGGCATGRAAAGWSVPNHLDGSVVLNAVSCLQPYFCVLGANDGTASIFNGSDWSGFADVAGSKHVDSVSCAPATQFCMAVDSDGRQITYDAGSGGWSSPTTVDGTNVLNSISCPTDTFCVAVDSEGQQVTWNEGTGGWNPAASVDGTNLLNSVSCPTATFCMAVDNSGNFVQMTGSSWGTATSIGDSSRPIEAVSCPTTSFCVAVDNDGNELTYSSGTWASPTTIDGTRVLNSVSCPTSSFCMAVDNDGNAVVWNGTSWTVTSIDSTRVINSVSCSSTTFCVAADANGRVSDFQGTGSADDLFSQTTPATSADPSGETTTFTYYPGRKPDVTTTPAGTTTDTYDAMGDLVNVDEANAASGYAATPSVSYFYYADGARYAMEDGTGNTFYTVDAQDDVTKQQVVSNTSTPGSTVDYSYYSTGALESVTYPAYGSTTSPDATYTYDALGNIASASDWLGNTVAFSHDQDGNETVQNNEVSGSSTSSTTFSYDGADENASTMSSTPCSSAALTQSFSGSTGLRNPDGQVKEVTEQFASGCGTSPSPRYYSYDQAGRVIYQGTVAQGSNSPNLAYDASGDPTTISNTQGGSFNKYTGAYDDAGEVTSQTPTGSGSSSTYGYDTLGDRTSDVSVSTTDYTYDQLGELTGTTDASTAQYTYSGDGLEDSASPTATGWTSPTATGDAHAINSVSCPTSSWCMAVDNVGDALLWNGSSWTETTGVDTTRPLESVSCPTTSFCAVVDNHGQMVIYSSGSWGTPTGIGDGTKVLDSVSCPTTTSTQCVVVDANGNAVNYVGSTWTPTSVSSYALNSVSCVTTTFCEAVDNHGHVFTFSGGSSWSSADDIDGAHPLESISCSSTVSCATVDNNGDAEVWNGTYWQGFTGIDSTRTLATVSCATSTFCIAVDTTGRSVTYDGYDWYAVTGIDRSNTPEAVSCPSESFCNLVDNVGDALTYTASDLTWDTNGSLPTVLSDGTNDYIYGPTGEPVEQISTTATQPAAATFMTFTSGNSSWLLTNTTGNVTGYYTYDAVGTLSSSSGVTSTFGYAGQYQGTSANSSGLENMRARWYDSNTGTFTTRDPAFGQTDQAYAYAGDDPVNQADPTGLYDYKLKELIGPVSGGDNHVGTAQQVMAAFQNYFTLVFPFPITGCSALYDGAQCDLHALDLYGTPAVFLPCSTPLLAGCGGVQVQDVTPTSFRFEVDQPGYFDAPTSTITFSTSESNCQVFLHQHGDAPKTKGLDATAHVFLAEFMAWPSQASNLTALMWELNDEEPGMTQPSGPPSPGFPSTPPAGFPT